MDGGSGEVVNHELDDGLDLILRVASVKGNSVILVHNVISWPCTCPHQLLPTTAITTNHRIYLPTRHGPE